MIRLVVPRFIQLVILFSVTAMITNPLTAQALSVQEFQQWVAGQPEYEDSMRFLYTILGTTLRAEPPRGRLARPFRQMGENPDNLVPTFHESINAVPDWRIESSLPASLSTLYNTMYPMELNCSVSPLPLPATLIEAAAQIESLAGDVLTLELTLLPAGQRRFLRQNHAHMMGILQRSPWGGGIAEQDINTLIRWIDTLDQADMDTLFCPALLWGNLLDAQWLERLQELMNTHPQNGQAVILQQMTPFGLIRFGGKANSSVLSGNILFTADLEGDDIYALRTADAWSGLPQYIVDFAGNDIYESQEPGGYASGIGSVSFLTDFSGDDTYHAATLTQGAGIFGIGILHDLQGNDEYNAAAMAQGAALFGAGLLLDEDGHDHYQITGLGQGLGITEGVGILSDRSGNDHYLSTGLTPTNYGTPGLSDTWSQGAGVGMRQVMPGGVGILDDGNGSDDYMAGSFSQGGGYYYGLGLLRDSGDSDDSYLGSRYNVGWAAHAGLGYFLEEGGNDHYKTRQWVISGLSWDSSMVLFEDLAGDDLHETGGFSLGASAHRSIVVFHDYAGSDTYLGFSTATPTQGPPNLSVFIDTGEGNNQFAAPVVDLPCTTDMGLSFNLITSGSLSLDALNCATE